MNTIQMERLPQAICWHEGMLLSPQHFQQNHIYWETQLQYLRANMAPDNWGIIELSIDQAHLMGGEVFINRLRAVMPDGLLIDHDAEQDEPIQLSLAEAPDLVKNGRVMVHLTVPIRVPGSASENAVIQRYHVCDSTSVVDDNTGEGERVMPRLQAKIELQAANRVSKKYIALPLFEVCQPDGASFQLGNYCPPILNIAADEFRKEEGNPLNNQPLQQRCQALALAIRKKARQLAGLSEDEELTLGRRVNVQHRQWIRSMVKDLAEFELLVDNRQTTAFALYQGIARIIGSISELDPGGIPPKLPRYQHGKILESFNPVLRYIKHQIDRVNLNYTSIVFDEEREGLFSLVYDKAWNGNLLVELTAKGDTDEAEIVNWFESCRIASANLHKQLAKQRLLGAEVKPISSDEKTGIAASPGRFLFRIKCDPQFIKPGQLLVMTCTNNHYKGAQPKRITLHLPHE